MAGDDDSTPRLAGGERTATHTALTEGVSQRRGTFAGIKGAFSSSPVPTAITRASDGVIVFANVASLQLLGWPATEFVGRTMDEVGFWTHPESRAAMHEELDREGVVNDVEQEITTYGGERRTVLVSIAYAELDGEQCLVGHIHDITERRLLEERVRESEERFRQVTETFQQGFLLRNVDPPGVLYASPAVARIFGVDLHVIYRDPGALERLVHPDDRETLISLRDEMTEATDFEYRIIRPDGETRWVRTRAEPVRMENGRATRIAAASEDTTDERVLLEALRDSEQLFRLLAEYSTDVIGRLSHDGRIEYVSPASATVYGYEPEEMVGRFGSEFIHPDDLAAMTTDFSPEPGEFGVITSAYRVLRGDGEYVWIEAKIRALRDPATNAVVEFHTVARDVSERKQAEADVRRAKEEAELANAAKGEFLSRMSHELRTPLHAILGFGELLERRNPTPEHQEQLDQIMKAGRHLLELINEVLDLSRIDDGALRLSLEPVGVGELVKETLEMLEPVAAASSVSLARPRFEPPDMHVLADRQRLKQALLNLLSNAVKYNREGGEVRVAGMTAGSPLARIEVADTGLGIAPGDIERAFSAFERLGAEATEVEGTGLGLALTKRLIEAMGGTIGVESEVGRGTTFWLDLPEVPAPAAAAKTRQRVDEPAVRPLRTDARTVLYIEDNPSNIKLVETILRERPEVTLLVAQQGRLGMDLAREHAPALVLLDLNLPDISGEEILRRLRADERTAAIPIVVVSADATVGQVARLRDGGADGYLTKPFDIEQFLAVIDGLPVASAPAEPSAAAAPQDPPDGPERPPLDPSSVDKLLHLHPDGHAVRELVEIYLADAPVRLEALERAARANEPGGVRDAAHAWRGSASMTGAHRLVELLSDIEVLARVGTVPDADELAAVRDAYEESRVALIEQFA